jgi:hypothetical protein
MHINMRPAWQDGGNASCCQLPTMPVAIRFIVASFKQPVWQPRARHACSRGMMALVLQICL